MNEVSVLKLIWRVLSANSLWVKWIHTYIIRKGSIWTAKVTALDSWMWKKILKYRDKAKQFCKVEVKNGKKASFWNEKWYPLGHLKELLGNGSHIDLGISIDAKVEECIYHRRRNHRVNLLNRVELEIERFKATRQQGEEDISLWKCSEDKYKRTFSTKDTWQILREKHQVLNEYKGIWFKHSTPKFSFLIWVAVKNRLSTGDCMVQWNSSADASCIFCHNPLETISHLFFECSYSKQIWGNLAGGVLSDQYTECWEELLKLITDSRGSKLQIFTARYIFQAVVHNIWRERNRRRHGEKESPAILLTNLI